MGAIPSSSFSASASAASLVRKARRRRPILLPLLSAAFFFVSAYLYLIAVGRNVPVWVYGVIAGIVLGGGGLAVRRTRRRLSREQGQADHRAGLCSGDQPSSRLDPAREARATISAAGWLDPVSLDRRQYRLSPRYSPAS